MRASTTERTPSGEGLAGTSRRGAGAPPGPVALFVRRHPLACFLTLAYALSWAYWLPLAFTGRVVVAGSGSPTQFPGLLGPAVAAFIVTALTQGRAGLRDLVRRMGRWRVGWRWYAAVAAPVSFFALAAAVAAAGGAGWPPARDLAAFSGLPRIGLLGAFALAVLVNGYGEETGWRGLALPLLQRRHRPLVASLVLAVGWAGWHLPLFFILDSYRDFGVVILPGFLIGLACGSIVLASIYNGTGGSVLMVALWHATYNMTSATAAAKGTIAAIVSGLVIAWAAVLVALDLTAGRRGRPSPLAWRAPAPRRRYGARNRILNPAVRRLLSSPLHRLLSGAVLLLTYTGTRTGRAHTVPVQYARGEDGGIVIFVADHVHKGWWRNLRQPAAVRLRIAGATLDGTARAIVADPDRVAAALRPYFQRFPQAARAAGLPGALATSPDALRQVAETAAVVCVELDPTPRPTAPGPGAR
jgi:deazaflavin-dependent oxidoreductase (nitroreductase family)